MFEPEKKWQRIYELRNAATKLNKIFEIIGVFFMATIKSRP